MCKATIHLTTPAGAPVDLEIGAGATTDMIQTVMDRAAKIADYYLAAGWGLPHAPSDGATGPAAAELAQGPTFAGYPCSPTVDDQGRPTWIIVDGVQAQRREKQGDVWYSAKTADGYHQVLRIPKGETAPAVRGLE